MDSMKDFKNRILLFILFIAFFNTNSAEYLHDSTDLASNSYLNNNSGIFDTNIDVNNKLEAIKDIKQYNENKTYKNIYSTFIGGTGDETFIHAVIDDSKNVYIAGRTSSLDFPLINEGNLSFGTLTSENGNIFFFKINALGDVVFSKMFGGDGSEEVSKVVLDHKGDIYITGVTDSSNFPTKKSFSDTNSGGTDIFLTKFDPYGNLLFSTYIGGEFNEEIRNIAFDSLNNIIMVGLTDSSNFPTLNAFNNTKGDDNDAFISKFSQDGNLLFSTFIGGNGNDLINSVITDDMNNIFLLGETFSIDFPVQNGLIDTFGGGKDSIFVKFNENGVMQFSTYLGGRDSDDAVDLKTDSKGNIFIVGNTLSNDFPTKDGFRNVPLNNLQKDGYLMKFDSNGNLYYSSYFGGLRGEEITHIAVDPKDDIFITGITTSGDFPHRNHFDNTLGGETDAFIAKFDGEDGNLLISSNIGGNGFERVTDLVIDNLGFVYITGYSNSLGFPNINSFNKNNGGGFDSFIMKLNTEGEILLSSFFGGEKDEFNQVLLVNDENSIHLLGETSSMNFSTFNSFDDFLGGEKDGFLIKISKIVDNDQDGIDDEWEINVGLNPLLNDAGGDPDGDELTNFEEFILNTSPIDFDTDDDGIDDGYEYNNGFDPLTKDSEIDSDGDFSNNLEEYRAGTDPYNPLSFPIFSLTVFYIIVLGLFIILLCLLVIVGIFTSIKMFKLKSGINTHSYLETLRFWKSDFDDYQIYQHAKKHGASTMQAYDLLLKYKTPNVEIATEVMKGSFKDYEEYLNAKAVGASSQEDYQLILKFEAPDYEIAREVEKSGFSSYEEYVKSKNSLKNGAGEWKPSSRRRSK